MNTPTDKEAEDFASIFRTVDGFCSMLWVYRKPGETDLQMIERYEEKCKEMFPDKPVPDLSAVKARLRDK